MTDITIDPLDQRRQHLVGVHVRGRARAGLEHIDRELVVELTGRDPVSGSSDPLSDLGVEQAEVRVDSRGGALDPPKPVDHSARNRLAGDPEVLDCLACLASVEGLCAHERRPFRGG